MHELDLIPASYRERLKIQYWCHVFAVIFFITLLTVSALKFMLVQQASRLRAEIQILQQDRQITMQQQRQYNDLLGEEKRLLKQQEILDGLRGGPAIRQIFLVIDRVMNGDVWFEKWTFKRAGEITKVKPTTIQTGYFIIIDEDVSGVNKQQAWRLNTHMEINGQALGHASLAAFVRRLLEQPEIKDVQVLQTNLRSHIDVQVVDFKVVVIVNNQFRADDV